MQYETYLYLALGVVLIILGSVIMGKQKKAATANAACAFDPNAKRACTGVIVIGVIITLYAAYHLYMEHAPKGFPGKSARGYSYSGYHF